MRHQPSFIALLTLAFLVSDPATSLAASGGGAVGGGGAGNSGSDSARRKVRSPGKNAEAEYLRGLKKRDNAWKHEKRAAEATSDQKRDYELEKAAKDWFNAAKHDRKAIRSKSDFHQAYSSLGYALRKQGNYPESIAAYDRALRIDSRYAEAIEYRAEAYLALNRIREATDSYMRLFSLDRDKASLLMTAMEAWVSEAQTTPPDDVNPDMLQWFSGWVDRRKQI